MTTGSTPEQGACVCRNDWKVCKGEGGAGVGGFGGAELEVNDEEWEEEDETMSLDTNTHAVHLPCCRSWES